MASKFNMLFIYILDVMCGKLLQIISKDYSKVLDTKIYWLLFDCV